MKSLAPTFARHPVADRKAIAANPVQLLRNNNLGMRRSARIELVSAVRPLR